jgi:hypothetical protein
MHCHPRAICHDGVMRTTQRRTGGAGSRPWAALFILAESKILIAKGACARLGLVKGTGRRPKAVGGIQFIQPADLVRKIFGVNRSVTEACLNAAAMPESPDVRNLHSAINVIFPAQMA